MLSSKIRRLVPAWLTLAFLFLVAAAQPTSAQSLTTDKDDYQPGDTAVLTGTGFAPNEMVTMLVMHIDGSASIGVAHVPWFVDADANGEFMALWECLEDCRGATLLATADQLSGPHAQVEYTDALGVGRVSSVVPLDGGCVSTDVPCTACGFTSGTGAVQSWYVQQGKTYAVTLSCLTNCAAAGTAPTLEVVIPNTNGGSAPNQCLTATKVATGVYTFTITMPAEACYSFPILYCTSGCSTVTGFNARRCDGRNFQAQLKAAHFLPGCVPVALPNFADECCSTPAVLGVPADTTVECSAVPTAPTLFGLQNCTQCSVVSVSFQETSTQGAVGTCAYSSYEILRTWTVTDGCGMQFVSSQTITVRDTSAPAIGGQGADATLECPATPVFTAPTASDFCNSASVVLVSDVTTPGCGGTYSETKTWKAIDPCGNESGTVHQTIALVDTTPPVIGAPGPDATLECPAAPVFTAPAATDGCSAVSVVLVSDVTTPACGGTFSRTMTWKAVDACGNESDTVHQTIVLVDTTPPIIGPAGADATIECSVQPHFTVPLATDTCCCCSSVVQVSDVTTYGCGASYVERKTWKAVDACGNESGTVSQTLTVVDTVPPVLTSCAPDIVINGSGVCCAVVESLGRPTAVDSCSMVVYQSNPRDGACFPLGDTTVNWIARDGCGNFVTCAQNVRVLGQIHATKFYDSNADGIREIGEPGIPGWKFALSDGQTQFTNANGDADFNVAAGTYTVTDFAPLETSWVATTPTSYPATVSYANPNPSYSFGDYSFAGPANGYAPGYWGSPQGASVLQANDPAWRNELTALNLRDAAGNNFDLATGPSFNAQYGAFTAWLNSANPANMAYMLSAQLATAKLDALYMGLNESTSIVVPGGVSAGGGMCIVPFLSVAQNISCGAPPLLSLASLSGSNACGCSSHDGVVMIGDLFARADCLLGAYGNASGPSTQRTYQECVKVVLDMIVHNGNNGYACGALSQYIHAIGSWGPATFLGLYNANGQGPAGH